MAKITRIFLSNQMTWHGFEKSDELAAVGFIAIKSGLRRTDLRREIEICGDARSGYYVTGLDGKSAPAEFRFTQDPDYVNLSRERNKGGTAGGAYVERVHPETFEYFVTRAQRAFDMHIGRVDA